MTRIVIDIYRYFQRHRLWGWILFAVTTGIALLSTLSVGYKEDIRDFLPFGVDDARSMEIYQEITGANRVYAVITSQSHNNEALMDAVDSLVNVVGRLDTMGYVSQVIAGVEEDIADRVVSAVYDLMPLLLTDADYDRIDSLLASPGMADEKLLAAKEVLQMPASSVVVSSLQHDPLGFFSPVMGRLTSGAGQPEGLDTGDGYFMSEDGTAAFVMFESPFGPNETNLNGLLVDMLEEAADEVVAGNEAVDIQFTGSPVIAVGNARSIKRDSLWSVIAATLAIMALLIYVFRNARNIVLIFVSVAWGWLFAMGAIGLYYDSISIIVVGIASVMLGIAVNYPLHLVDHLSECTDRIEAIGQVVAPLVVGNVTTVGAFLCLVPLDSPALHDLGLFSSMLLIGTILFVLIFLPHSVKIKQGDYGDRAGGVIGWLARLMSPGKPRRLWWLLLPTLVLGYFSLKTGFDPDLRNINYLSDGQKAVFDRLERTFGSGGDGGTVYVAASGSTWDEATVAYERLQQVYKELPDSMIYNSSCHQGGMILSRESQLKRLDRWARLADSRDSLSDMISRSGTRYGFSDNAFAAFGEMLSRHYETVGEKELEPLTGTLLRRNVCVVDGMYSIVDAIRLRDGYNCQDVIDMTRHVLPDGVVVFDAGSMGRSMTGALADDFNYIGLMCGLIVFVFLWLSMGRIELAIVSFLPMAVSWIWILGIMGLLGLQFNIVNVILATFIFGQGDDYTIFVTEGLMYEYASGRRLVMRFKSCIIVSALMMFAGIGVLVFASHPAMRSLGQVAVIGMFTVVVMACIIPPLLFRFLTCCGDSPRLRPITLRSLVCNLWWRMSRWLFKGIPGIRIRIVDLGGGGTGDGGAVRAVERNVYIDSYIERYVAGKGYHGDIMIVGSEMLMSRSDRWYSPGHVIVLTGADEATYKSVYEQYVPFDNVCDLVLDSYLYKGAGAWREARRTIQRIRREGNGKWKIENGEFKIAGIENIGGDPGVVW